MSTAKQRVQKERTELFKKIGALEHSLSYKGLRHKLPPIQRTLMYLQVDKMSGYLHTLDRRLEEWDD
jgi:hypothetical protein